MESYEWKPWGKMTAREYREQCQYNQKVHEAEDFARSHPVLVGERQGTTLKQRLERIRDNAHQRNRKARETAIEYMRRLGYEAYPAS